MEQIFLKSILWDCNCFKNYGRPQLFITTSVSTKVTKWYGHCTMFYKSFTALRSCVSHHSTYHPHKYLYYYNYSILSNVHIGLHLFLFLCTPKTKVTVLQQYLYIYIYIYIFERNLESHYSLFLFFIVTVIDNGLFGSHITVPFFFWWLVK